MSTVALHGIDSVEIESAVGAPAYLKGVQYAKGGAVGRIRWDPVDNALHGAVSGRAGRVYETTAYFASVDGATLAFEQGQCSCPVGFNCKHVAALLLKVAATRAQSTPGRTAQPTWEASLESMLGSDQVGARAAGGAPLAVELTLADPSSVRTPGRGRSSAGSTPSLLARPMRRGKTGWVGGGLSWTKLGSLNYYGDYRAAHVQLLLEIYAVYRSRKDDARYYSYGDDRSIDLSTFESRQLWSMLDEAAAIGLHLIHGKGQSDAVANYSSARFCWDVTQREPSGSLVVTPVLLIDGAPTDAQPVKFIGAEGHGVVYVSRATDGRSDERVGPYPRLARLTSPVPPAVQHMVLDNQCLDIPFGELSRFRDYYYPRLRSTAAVISSDESFTPPEISDPTLVLHATYGSDHELDLGWEWDYQVGESHFQVSLDSKSTDGGYRDLDREREILASIDTPLDRCAPLRVGAERMLASRAVLGGIDTLRFTTEVLPIIADQPGIEVKIAGDAADYREVGDSVRIGVSTAEVAGDTDWFDLGVTITVEGRKVPFEQLFVALTREQSHLLLADGAHFSLEKPELRALRELISEARTLRDVPNSPLRISRFQAGLWDELAAVGVVDHQAREWQRQVQGLLSIDAVDPIEPPRSLVARLRPYQIAGFRWLAFLWECQLGGILADDMGLGKTLQSLALICHARDTTPSAPPFLIIAPTSVVSNWGAECARFAPDLKVLAIGDTARRRGCSLEQLMEGTDIDAVVTSYTLLRLDIDEYAALPWSGLLLDEAQFAKNHQAKIYQCVRSLSAPFRLAITGTPMENNLMELWSLLSITAPGLFPNPNRFQEYYARPIEKTGDAERLAQLGRRIKPLVTRRTKEQVAADLPAKQEQTIEVELHPRHRKLYQTYLQRERQKILGLIDDMNRNRFTILRSLTLLRQLSLHAGLIDDEHQNIPCAKIDVLFDQLSDVINGGHRALVFSQFTGFLGMVRARLDAAGMEYCYLDGTTRNRSAVLNRFAHDSVPVFLISLKAGGFGLNLTEADYCFLLDPWWNPATEAQAVDRTHRIGQTRNVMVYRLIAKDTIEEKVMALKARKAELFSSVMDEGNVFDATLDADDIRGLFV